MEVGARVLRAVFSENRGKISVKRVQKSTLQQLYSPLDVNLGLILVLVEDMGIIYCSTEPDF